MSVSHKENIPLKAFSRQFVVRWVCGRPVLRGLGLGLLWNQWWPHRAEGSLSCIRKCCLSWFGDSPRFGRSVFCSSCLLPSPAVFTYWDFEPFVWRSVILPLSLREPLTQPYEVLIKAVEFAVFLATDECCILLSFNILKLKSFVRLILWILNRVFINTMIYINVKPWNFIETWCNNL